MEAMLSLPSLRRLLDDPVLHWDHDGVQGSEHETETETDESDGGEGDGSEYETEVRQLRYRFVLSFGHFSRISQRCTIPHAPWPMLQPCTLLGAHAYWMLIGVCIPTLCPIHGIQSDGSSDDDGGAGDGDGGWSDDGRNRDIVT